MYVIFVLVVIVVFMTNDSLYINLSVPWCVSYPSILQHSDRSVECVCVCVCVCWSIVQIL